MTAGLQLIFDIAQREKNRSWRQEPPAVSHQRQGACWTRTSKDTPGGAQLLYGDTSGLLTFTQPKGPVDLNPGYPDAYVQQPWPKTAGLVEQIIYSMKAAKQPFPTGGVCSIRTNVRKIAATLIQGADPWAVDVTMYSPPPHSSSAAAAAAAGAGRATLFLDMAHLDDGSNNMDKNSFYGYSFECQCTGGAVKSGSVIDATAQYLAVIPMTLGVHSILMAAEMDCHEPLSRPNVYKAPARRAAEAPAAGCTPKYVELKTTKQPAKGREWRLYQIKYAQWWIQAHLAGVSKLFIGFRDSAGCVVKYELVDTVDLPDISKGKGHSFDANDYMMFAEEVLSWMRECALQHPGEQLRFQFDPKDGEKGTITYRRVVEGDLYARIAAAFV